eukprot:scaffold7428_cov248-Pinguiococcus_pyrenoidosus.AAC.5
MDSDRRSDGEAGPPGLKTWFLKLRIPEADAQRCVAVLADHGSEANSRGARFAFSPDLAVRTRRYGSTSAGIMNALLLRPT